MNIREYFLSTMGWVALVPPLLLGYVEMNVMAYILQDPLVHVVASFVCGSLWDSSTWPFLELAPKCRMGWVILVLPALLGYVAVKVMTHILQDPAVHVGISFVCGALWLQTLWPPSKHALRLWVADVRHFWGSRQGDGDD